MISQLKQSSFLKLSFFSCWLILSGCATNSPSGKMGQQTFAERDRSKKQEALFLPGRQLEDDPEILTSRDQERPQQEILDSAIELCEVSNDYWERGELDNAIDSLDQAYSLILMIDPDRATPEILQQKEDLRFTISKRIAEVYASRFTVANGFHKAIPLTMNRHVVKALDLFKRREKGFFQEAYRRSGRYRPAIVKALNEAGLPEELSWLPLIESGFKTKAFSRARALGMWQFIASTGYKFGLKRGPWIDERMDPEKSTTAAIAYLKELHQIFGDWTTVLAAYNCGEGRVLDVIRTQRINYLDNFWDLYEKLPEETAFYVPSFLAVLHIVNDPEAHGFNLPPVDQEIEFDKVPINKQVHLEEVARHLEIPFNTLKALNPALRQDCTPDRPYALKVPKGKGDIVCAKIDNMASWRPAAPVKRPSTTVRPAPSPVSVAHKVHKIKKGDTLYGISRRYKTSPQAIMALNNLKNKNCLTAGMSLKIPAIGAGPAPDKGSPTVCGKSGKTPVKYKVRKGDSLFRIARQFGTTTSAIQSANRISPANLRIGQVIHIPNASGCLAPVKTKTKSYKVLKGESSYTIAQKHRMSLSEFLALNDLTPKSTIYTGQTLLVTAQ